VLSNDARSRDLVDTSRVARLFAEHRSGTADHSFALWAVWMLERWARQEGALRLDDAGSTPASSRSGQAA
jgi:hypothetical protein